MNLLLKSLCILTALSSGLSFASDIKVNADELDEMRKALNTPSAVHGELKGNECINGSGSESTATAIIKPKEILEGARYQPEEDGFLVFDLPAGYVTDFGVRVNLKSDHLPGG